MSLEAMRARGRKGAGRAGPVEIQTQMISENMPTEGRLLDLVSTSLFDSLGSGTLRKKFRKWCSFRVILHGILICLYLTQMPVAGA
eukprot:772658-Rhodomonas_salina.2